MMVSIPIMRVLKQKIIFDGNITQALNSDDEFIKDFLTNKGK